MQGYGISTQYILHEVVRRSRRGRICNLPTSLQVMKRGRRIVHIAWQGIFISLRYIDGNQALGNTATSQQTLRGVMKILSLLFFRFFFFSSSTF